MMNDLRFAWYAIKKNIRNSTELRTSFVLTVIGMAINNTSFLVIWIFFIQTVGEINGWRSSDILALNGFVAISYGIVFSFFVGVRNLSQNIADGVLDRFLLSPKSVLVRVATSSFHASAIGDVLFGVVCFALYAWMVDVVFVQWVIIFFLTVGATLMFFAIALLANSIGFYFTDPQSVSVSIFQLFMTPTLYHGGIFQGAIRVIFTFVIPSLVISGLSVEAVSAISFQQMIFLLFLTIVWFVGSIWFFHYSIRKYESANFMTFGR